MNIKILSLGIILVSFSASACQKKAGSTANAGKDAGKRASPAAVASNPETPTVPKVTFDKAVRCYADVKDKPKFFKACHESILKNAEKFKDTNQTLHVFMVYKYIIEEFYQYEDEKMSLFIALSNYGNANLELKEKYSKEIKKNIKLIQSYLKQYDHVETGKNFYLDLTSHKNNTREKNRIERVLNRMTFIKDNVKSLKDYLNIKEAKKLGIYDLVVKK